MKRKIGDKIKRIRKMQNDGNGLSMEEFGKLFNPPASKGVVSNWENNYNYPNEKRLERIAELGGISVKELMLSDTDLKFGKALKTIREEKGYSIKELSEISGLSESHISEMEKGERSLGVNAVFALSKGLDNEFLTLIARMGAFGYVSDISYRIGDELSRLRRKHQLDKEELARKTGLSSDLINIIESGYDTLSLFYYVPSNDELTKILMYYGISLEEFLTNLGIKIKEFISARLDWERRYNKEVKTDIINHDKEVDLYMLCNEDGYTIDLGSNRVKITPTYAGEKISSKNLDKIKQSLKIILD